MRPSAQIRMHFVQMVSLAAPVQPSALLEITAAAEKVARVTSPRVVVAEVTRRDAREWAQAMVSVTELAPETAPAFSLPPRQLKAEKGRY